jgi:hypothetical protein
MVLTEEAHDEDGLGGARVVATVMGDGVGVGRRC